MRCWPVVQWGKPEAKIDGFVKNLLQVKLTEYAAAFPEIRVPLRSDFSIDLPANEQNISFPVPMGPSPASSAYLRYTQPKACLFRMCCSSPTACTSL